MNFNHPQSYSVKKKKCVFPAKKNISKHRRNKEAKSPKDSLHSEEPLWIKNAFDGKGLSWFANWQQQQNFSQIFKSYINW